MAITKTIITGSTRAQRAAEVLDYLQTYAADFFDSITADADGNISCIIDSVTALFLPYTSNDNVMIGLKNGTTFSDYYSGELVFSVAYRSAYGVMLKSDRYSVTISKNDLNHTVICATIQRGSGESTLAYWFADFTDGADIIATFGESSNFKATIAHSASLTAVVPAVFDSGHYSEGLCITPYSEYAASSGGILDVGGTQYGYDGAIALKG